MIPDKDTESIEKPTTTPIEPQKQASEERETIVNIPVKSVHTGKQKGISHIRVRPDTQNKVKRLRAKGESLDKIARLSGISKPTVLKIVNNPANKEQIETIKARLAEKAACIAEQSLDAIAPDDITKASLVQKATVFGIMTDKYNDLTDTNPLDIGDSSILSGLKSADLTEFIKSGNTVKIGIVIEPNKIPPKPVE